MKFKLPLQNLSKLSARERTAVSIGAAAVFLLIGYYAAVVPWLNYRAKLKKEIKKLEQIAVGGNLILSRGESISRDIEAMKPFLHKAGTPEMEIAAFLKEVESLASQSGIDLQEVRPLETSTSEWYQEYGLEVSYTTGMPEWVKFVYLIESSPSLLTIEKANLGLENEADKSLKGSMRIKRAVLFDSPSAGAAQ